MPEADPGAVIAHRWRKKFCTKGEIDDAKIEAHARKIVTLLDEGKLNRALADAQSRCLRVCEQENANTIRGSARLKTFEIRSAFPVVGQFECGIS